MWPLRRRQDADAGTLAPKFREGQAAMPGWEQRRRKAKDDEQWEARMA